MFTVDGIRKFHSWTHACMDVVIEHLSSIPAGDYSRPLPHFGSPTVRDQVIHIFNCEGFWVSTLRGLTYVDRRPADFLLVADAKLLQEEVSRKTHEYLYAMTDQQLNADTELRFPDGDLAVRTPAFVLHHVFTHAFHHKGQIVAMCRALGYPAPDTDLSQIR